MSALLWGVTASLVRAENPVMGKGVEAFFCAILRHSRHAKKGCKPYFLLRLREARGANMGVRQQYFFTNHSEGVRGASREQDGGRGHFGFSISDFRLGSWVVRGCGSQ